MEKDKDKNIDQSKIEEIKEEMIEAVQEEELNDVFSDEEEFTKVKEGNSKDKGKESMKLNEKEVDDLLYSYLDSEDENKEEKEVNSKEESFEDGKGYKKEKVGFFNKIMQGVIDQTLNILVALLILLALDGILQFIGLYIAQRISMFFVIYVIMNILYVPILEKTKLKATVGKKLLVR